MRIKCPLGQALQDSGGTECPVPKKVCREVSSFPSHHRKLSPGPVLTLQLENQRTDCQSVAIWQVPAQKWLLLCESAWDWNVSWKFPICILFVFKDRLFVELQLLQLFSRQKFASAMLTWKFKTLVQYMKWLLIYSIYLGLLIILFLADNFICNLQS